MELAVLITIAVVLGGSVAGGLATTWALHRRSLGLEYRIQDLEDRSLKVMNREKADKRWTKQQSFEEEFAAIAAQPAAPKSRRYANDPVEPMD